MIKLTLKVTLPHEGKATYFPEEVYDDTTSHEGIEREVREWLGYWELLHFSPRWISCTILMHHFKNGHNTHNEFIKIKR